MKFQYYLKAKAVDIIEASKELYGEGYKAADVFDDTFLADNRNFRFYRDIRDMTFGQFTVVEGILRNVADIKHKIGLLAPVLIRPKDEKVFDNTDLNREDDLRKAIGEMPTDFVLEVINDFTKSRKDFLNNEFKGVFYKAQDEEEDEEDNESQAAIDFEQKFYNDWYFYEIKNMLAKEDITKHAEIEDTNIVRIAVHLSYIRTKNKIEYKRRKDDELKNIAKYGL